MTSDSSEWDKDLPADPEEDYQAFIRILERTEGFRLLFVQCTTAGGEQLIARVKEDILHKTIEVLRLDKPIENLYEIVERLPNREKISILFIQNLEQSLYEYETVNFKDATERYSYTWEGVPPILNHLNQQRERFRDDFNICFIFLLRPFSIKYFIHRAQDFFDWRSSMFEFPTNPKLLEQESSRNLREKNYYLEAELFFEIGLRHSEAGEDDAAITSFDKALAFNPDNDAAWNNRGIALKQLGRIKEALTSYDKALEIKPDKDQAWNNRGIVLAELGQTEKAIASFDKALEFKPYNDTAWYNRGNALKQLGRLEEAIASYDKALEFNPDDDDAWYNRGNALAELGHAEKAIASYDKALAIKPDKHKAWYNRGTSLDELERFEEAIASYDKALEFTPDDDEAWYNKARCYALLNLVDLAIENLQQAINLNPEENRKMATTEPDFDSIREDKRFQALIL